MRDPAKVKAKDAAYRARSVTSARYIRKPFVLRAAARRERREREMLGRELLRKQLEEAIKCPL